MSIIKQTNPWYIGTVSGMASYIDSAAIVSSGTALVIYSKTIGVTAGQIGIFSGVLTLCIALGAFFGGRLGDMFGRKKVFITTMAMIVVGALLMAFGRTFPLLLLGTLLLGLATGADLPVSLATISEAATDKNRGKIIGLSNLLWAGGVSVSMAIASVVGSWGILGAQILYFHIGITGIALLILRSLIPESPLWLAAHHERLCGVKTIRAQTASFKDLFNRKYLTPFIALCLFYMLTNLAANTSGQFGAYIAVNIVGIPIETHSFWSLLMLPVCIVSGVAFMKLVDTPKRMTGFIVGAFFYTAGFVMPVLFNFAPFSWFCAMLFTSTGAGLAFEGIMKVWSQESFPTMLRSTAQGIIVAVSRLTCGLLAFVTPLLLEMGTTFLYTVLSCMAGVGMVIGWLCFHGNQRNEFNSEADIIQNHH
ncbi:MFS transporter [Buttiauxella ferragutiae]|uniref:MFS transporter n=1 Tax=Buttiauxella ferragutiae TaxID=82989 RepID=UPI001F534BC9|nr:MFS transporter [Buttiauxella ferragutiae]UNK60364.1 MFS transporter [Buttiauxella ferragutiae]